jgi:hypothetical protein
MEENKNPFEKFNDDKFIEKLQFKPHQGQIPVIAAIKNINIREIALVCGRRWGKSFLMSYVAIREMVIPNRRVWIVAPTTDLTQKVFTYLVQFIGKLYTNKEYKITTKPYPKLLMANGSYIECRTASNPESLIGDEVNLLIIDEAARLSPMTYERELSATTMTRRGRTIFISTPRGKNWFYDKYIQIRNSIDGFTHNAPSSDNPLNTTEELEKKRKNSPDDIFKEEYLAQFSDSGREVFRGVDDVVNQDCYENPKPEHRYILGVDLGRVNDWTVLTVIDRQTHKVVHWERFNQIDWKLQKERIIVIANKYNRARVIIDSTGLGNPISEEIKREGLSVDDFVFTGSKSQTGKSKRDLIDKASIYIQEGSVFIPNEKVLIDELKIFSKELTDSGNLTYSAPVGMHDDCVCSLALAIWGLFSRNVSSEIKLPIPDNTPDIFKRRQFRKPTK